MNKAVHIVNTRKYDEDKRAVFGRNGDTKIRPVAGQDSHVTAFEAYMIDVNGRAAEDMVKRNGAGTLNPVTSMPEYHNVYEEGGTSNLVEHFHFDYDADEIIDNHEGLSEYTAVDAAGNAWGDAAIAQYAGISEDVRTVITNETSLANQKIMDKAESTFAALYTGDMGVAEYAQSEFGVDVKDYEQYITGFDPKKFEFIGEERDLADQKAEMTAQRATQDLSLAQSFARDTSMDQMTQLGTSAGRQFSDARAQADQAMAQTGMAFSGTVSSQMNQQKDRLLSDYETGISGVQKNLANVQTETQFGTQRATEDLDFSKSLNDFNLRKSEYTEQLAQMDQLHTDILNIKLKQE
jgi:hypothetical protein